MTLQPKAERNELKPVDIDSKKELLKKTICRGISDDEFELFAQICRQTGLNPFVRQIWMVPRGENVNGKWTEKHTVQVSIDGFRLIAERTGNYSPGRESTFDYDKEGNIRSATSYVKKRTDDGTWHEVACTAFYTEYVQTKKDGNPTKFWDRMPHVMLAKCAESIALRKAFPAQLSGLYTQEEMGKENSDQEKLTEEQFAELDALIMEINDQELIDKFVEWAKIPSIYDIEPKNFQSAVKWMQKKIKENKEKINESSAVA